MKNLIIPIAALSLAACAVQPKIVTPYSTGGSKADASVEMTYGVSYLQAVKPDWVAAQRDALKRCQAWGYSTAEAFDGVRKSCTLRGTYGNCLEGTVTRAYQCSGG